MTSKGSRISWFVGIYLLSLGAYALVVLLVKNALHLLHQLRRVENGGEPPEDETPMVTC